VAEFADQLLEWFDRAGRKDLPWQKDRTPYRVWVSEIMLQQTQVTTVIPYYQRFMQSFPDLHSLASADLDQVLAHWAGLGYYSRARNLHRAAQIIVQDFGGQFPNELDQLQNLPGIGRSTAGAIMAQALNRRGVILDGNVKRVLARYHGISEWPGRSAIQKQLWELADRHTPDDRLADYSQAIMDLGATLCNRKPQCDQCPLIKNCAAHRHQLTDQIPAKKPRKPQPLREVHMLIMRNSEGAILLERRPPTGIWGGLWSLPECMAEELEGHLKEWPGSADVLEIWEPREHQFSHFRLRYTPVEIDYQVNNHQLLDSDQRIWYKKKGEMVLGMPAPIKTLLNQLGE
jgi:A/G-specific adenine glycosylase